MIKWYRIRSFFPRLRTAFKYGRLAFNNYTDEFEPGCLRYISMFLKEQEKIFKKYDRHTTSKSDAKRMRAVHQAIDLLIRDDYYERCPIWKSVNVSDLSKMTKLDRDKTNLSIKREAVFRKETREWIYKQLIKHSPGWWM